MSFFSILLPTLLCPFTTRFLSLSSWFQFRCNFSQSLLPYSCHMAEPLQNVCLILKPLAAADSLLLLTALSLWTPKYT